MKQKILAIDDEPHVLILLERIVTEKTPYQITTTNNVLEVPELLEKNQYDVIVTDLKMPGMDGLELLRMIKEKNRKEEVIMITAFGSLESAVEAIEQGVFDYITKPFKVDHFIFTINRAMKLQKIRREAEKLTRIFNMEPYEEARKLFDREYIQRLLKRSDSDKILMVKQSGLSLEFIEKLISDKNPESSNS